MIILALIGVIAIVAVIAMIVGLCMTMVNQTQNRECHTMSDRFLQRSSRETEQRIYKNIFMPIVTELWYLILLVLLCLFVSVGKIFS